MTGRATTSATRPDGTSRGQRRAGRVGWATGLLLALAGCHAAAAAAPTYAAPAVPATQQVACSPSADSTQASDNAAAQRMPALLDLLADGRPLATAMQQLYGKPIAGLTTTEQEEALYLLSGLDACATVGPDVTADVPRLVRLIALGGPAAVPLTVPPPPLAAEPTGADPTGSARVAP